MVFQVRKKLDLRLADVDDSPLVIFIHGGYWQLLSKDDCLFPAKDFVDTGISYCSIDYTLAPRAHINEMIGAVHKSGAMVVPISK